MDSNIFSGLITYEFDIYLVVLESTQITLESFIQTFPANIHTEEG